jgi:hypothetical protein
MNRGSPLVRIVRKLLTLNRVGASFIGLILRMFPERNVGHIYIIGAPRSGTTITYQRFISNFNVKYLDNYLHLMFGVPFFRGMSNWFAPSYKEHSTHGFVSGLRGAAEGLHFWDYWTNTRLKFKQDFRFRKGFRLYIDYMEPSKRPFITCYIPHLGHVHEILDQDPNAFVVLLHRNSEAVLKSLKKIYQEKFIPEEKWFSYQPDELPTTEGLDLKLQAQVGFYNTLLEQDKKSDEIRVLEVTYEEMVDFNSVTKDRILFAYNTFAKTRNLSILKARKNG